MDVDCAQSSASSLIPRNPVLLRAEYLHMLGSGRLGGARGAALVYASRMTGEAKRILEQALKLPPESRAELVTGILASLEDEADQFDDNERDRLHAALEEAHVELERGEGIPAAKVIDELRARE